LAESGPAFRIQHVGRGLAVADFDNDGDMDIAVSDSGGSPLLLRNDGGNRNHWIALRARGRESNRFGIGAKVRVTSGGRTRLREVNPYGSYLSTSDVRLYFRTGQWNPCPHRDRVAQREEAVARQRSAGQILLLDEADAKR
jgi:hypothetical protein